MLDLWSDSAALAAAPAEGLNDAQSQATAAISAGGGWLVWGPPGTGKTTVISRVIAQALMVERSVLVASHTHVAVDNVLKGLADVASAPGHVVRVGSEEKLDTLVREHAWLTLDKAAAVLTRREQRLAELQRAKRANAEHPDRRRLAELVERLDTDAVVRIEQAIEARHTAVQAAGHQRRLTVLDHETTEHTERAGALAGQAAAARAQAEQLPDLQAKAQIADQGAHAAETRRAQAQAQLADLRLNHARELTRQQQTQAQLTSWPARFGWRRSARTAELDRARDATTQLDIAIRGLSDSLTALIDAARQAAARAAVTGDAARAAERTAAQHTALQREQHALHTWLDELAAEQATTRTALAEARAAEARTPDHAQILGQAEQAGILALLAERDRLNERVAALDNEHTEIIQRRQKLDDEYADTKRTLLTDAPIIGCTIDTLAAKPELDNRRFDTVIIDEAAAASIPQVVYAASKADRSLAIVGDFLQNAPITDPPDAVTDRQRALLPWQRDDIFTLLGITDRASAERHPRCIPLRTQYRYPPAIANIVNAFCYDGLLHSHQANPPDGSTVITFIDTSTHPRQGLRSAGKSWTHPLGVEIMLALCADHPDQHSIGMVFPYNGQERLAITAINEHDLAIRCGTSHKFQGRQFDTVIVDLMQDANQRRWVADANIHGNQRAVSAAKLLNVAITRTKQRLYLIGDWPFIKRSASPGMRALAALDTSSHFQRIHATALVPTDPDHAGAQQAPGTSRRS